jgi:hypothetical protein
MNVLGYHSAKIKPYKKIEIMEITTRSILAEWSRVSFG